MFGSISFWTHFNAISKDFCAKKCFICIYIVYFLCLDVGEGVYRRLNAGRTLFPRY